MEIKIVILFNVYFIFMRIIIYFYIVGVCSVFIKIKFDFFDYFFVDWQIMEYVLIINVICWGENWS